MAGGGHVVGSTEGGWSGVGLQDDFLQISSDAGDVMEIVSAREALLHMGDGIAIGDDFCNKSLHNARTGSEADLSNDAYLTEGLIASGPDGSSPPYKKRRRRRSGSDIRVGPPREIGAVEAALRNASTRQTTYVFEPLIGTSFDSLAEAYEFYNLYSWEVGYGIRYGSSYTNADKYRTSQELVCQLEGIDKREQNDSARCGCKAMIRLHRSEDHGWFVALHRAEHNHPLSEVCGEKMQWNSHKKIDQATRDMVRYLRENNVSLSKVHCILGSMHGSMENLPFTKKSLRTICQQIAHEQREDDIKKTMDIFRTMHSDDPDFGFRFQLDNYGRIKNLIWTAGRSRRQYICFGDVVVFDTTYTTNIYKMPFGLFVGVNNHFQTVIYAGILMREETIESFDWAYTEFVSLMGGKVPVTMLTDQCRAMEVSIARTLPTTTHRWCKWHVFRKAKEQLGGVWSKKTGFKDAFSNVVNEMLTVDEFECAWTDLLDKFDIRGNSFLIRAYEARHKWAKPYFKDKYCARMTSTQRVESANHMLKAYVPRNSSMNKFVSQYNKLLVDRNEAEDSEEHKNRQCNRQEKGGWPVERHARMIYTRAAFARFKAEMSEGASFMVKEKVQNVLYVLEHCHTENRNLWARTTYEVRVEDGPYYRCECGLYGHFGIICRHVIRLMIQLGVTKIPGSHILKRWTKDARDVLNIQSNGTEADRMPDLPKHLRHNILYVSVLEIVKMGNVGDEAFRIAMKHIKAAKNELTSTAKHNEAVYESSGAEADDEGAGCMRIASNLPGLALTGAVTADGVVMRHPMIKRPRGRPRLKRYKSFMDGSTKQSVKRGGRKNDRPDGISQQSSFCSSCKNSGHNITTCPMLHPSVTKPVRRRNQCRRCKGHGHNSATCDKEFATEVNT